MATKNFIIEECTSEECCKDCKDKTAWCFQLCERYIPDNNLATMKIKEYDGKTTD